MGALEFSFVHKIMDWPLFLQASTLICTVLLLLATFTLGRRTKERSTIKGPKGWPYVGVFPEFVQCLKKSSVHILLQKWAKEYGKVYKFQVMGQTWYIISEQKLANKVLLSRPADFSRGKMMDPINEMGFTGVFSAAGETWDRQRRITTPAFTALKMSDKVGPISLVLARLLQQWEAKAQKQETINAFGDLQKFTLDVVSLIAFNFDMNALGGDSQMQTDVDFVFKMVWRRIFSPFPTWRYPLLASKDDRELVRALERLREVVARAVVEHQSATHEPGKVVNDNLMMRLLQGAAAEGADGGKQRVHLTEQEVFGNILTFFLGGQDTTASTSAWALLYLATMPHVQAKVQEEVDRVMGPVREGETVVEALSRLEPSELKYITAVIKETLRLKPAGPWLVNQPNKSVKLAEGMVVHPNDMVIVLSIAMSKSEEFFENALTFDPGRWETDTHSLGHSPGSSPFGSGKRICPGRFLAFLEVQLLLAAVCQRFVVTLADECPADSVREVEALTMRPSHLMLQLQTRK